MNAVDVTARGLARRALGMGTSTREGDVNIDARSEPTAQALEALAAQSAVLTGYAGATHTVETAPFLRRDDLVIRGNGARLRNTNATPWTTNDFVTAALPLGTSDLLAVTRLTLDTIAAVNGNVVSLPAGAGLRYAPSGHFYCRGDIEHSYPSGALTFRVPRNVKRGRILAVEGDDLTLDCALPAELLADNPKIGTTAENVDASIAGQKLYFLYRPRISNFTLTSDQGEAAKMGGIIGGVIRDLHVEAVNGFGLGGLERTLVENVTFLAHRKIAEIAECSNGVVYRNFHGTLVDGPGAPAPFFIQIGENSTDCLMEWLNVSCGGLDCGTASNACALQSGRRNTIRNSTLDFRGHSGTLTALQCFATAGNSCDDSGYCDLTVLGQAPLQFFAVNDNGAGINRGFWRNVRFFGMPTADATGGTVKRAGWLRGNGTVYERVWCEHGAAEFGADATNITVRDCYFPDGFVGLTNEVLTGNDIRDNDSDANRRLRSAAVVVVGNSVQITDTTANQVYQSATIEAGDLEPGDRVFVYTEASAGGPGGTNRQARLSLTVNGTTTGIGSIVKTANGSAMGYEAELTVLVDNGTVAVLGYRINAGGAFVEGVFTVGSLKTTSFAVNMEYWCASASDPVNARVCRIIPVKRGMKHLPLR